ncbi:Uncharacterised protein [Vibrio cholerae]|nr:Uncharacterised protein [Vibrio cholerae]
MRSEENLGKTGGLFFGSRVALGRCRAEDVSKPLLRKLGIFSRRLRSAPQELRNLFTPRCTWQKAREEVLDHPVSIPPQ